MTGRAAIFVSFEMTMQLVQVLLPLRDNQGRLFKRPLHTQVRRELARRYQGLTAYTQSPAEGLWKRGKSTNQDQIVVYEVMTDSLDTKWWHNYRARLEKRFRQRCVVIRAHEIKML